MSDFIYSILCINLADTIFILWLEKVRCSPFQKMIYKQFEINSRLYFVNFQLQTGGITEKIEDLCI